MVIFQHARARQEGQQFNLVLRRAGGDGVVLALLRPAAVVASRR